ncbi:hypothetical protein DFH07DRAFT_100311 [Mycena maculata]|uniref:protein-tyrosine-phosphatase n=1 Tax=Mycena maculata TaxID=230809 RepID=A0AAD7JY72_9AGAR|nr:hypothetical protein DFH07DRAFT_100311 [Mycena maculata]
MPMDEIISGLWVGDLPSATDTTNLKANNIFSILSAMRGRVTINETFVRHQILLDDTEEADVLVHFIPAITFIQAELDKGRGVLVHCQAGMSRSVTIVAAYLMCTQNIDTQSALDIIRKARPNIEPNPGFLLQLEIFYKAAYKISRRDKTTRMFYLERAVGEVMNGDGSLPETDMFAKYPRTPTDSAPGTPGGPRRRIRCKMCRQELATREHMLDHGQLGAPTPAAATPVGSRHPSMSMVSRPRLGSIGIGSSSSSNSRPRRPSGLAESMSMSALDTDDPPPQVESPEDESAGANIRRTPSDGMRRPRLRPLISGVVDQLSMSALSMSALETEDDSGSEDGRPPPAAAAATDVEHEQPPLHSTHAFEAAARLGRRLSDAVIASPASKSPSEQRSPETEGPPAPPTTHFSSSDDLAAQLFAHPKLRGLGPLTPLQSAPKPLPASPPILVNPKCSGYFVEPMKWMEPFLESGQIAGKIACPNKKCGAKLGNYDWAGMCCGCKEWVTPGFCINRSKVDEVV